MAIALNAGAAQWRIKMLVVNLFGSPGTGKSTLSAYIFSQLKLMGVNCELVFEFAKDLVWEENYKALENQLYVSGQQSYRLSRLKDKVDVVIVDNPLILGGFYNHDENIDEDLNRLLLKIFNSYNNMNFFLRRVKKYNPIGRMQTEEESNQIAWKLLNLLIDSQLEYEIVEGNLEGGNYILDKIVNRLSKVED